jgi:phosphonate transport system substrate-binding protein
MFRLRRFALLGLAATLFAAGCSDDTSDSSSNKTVAASSGATGAAPSTTAADPKAGWPKKLVFAAVPSEQGKQLQESYKVTLEILRKELGVEIEFQQAADYSGVIEAQIAGKVDIAQYGPFAYVLARNGGAKIEPVGVIQGTKGVEPGYRSYGITQLDNAAINKIEDFAGKKVCFVDPGSTSGFLYPSAGLLAAKINPQTGVKGTFAGGHDASALAVAKGDCEAGFAFDTMLTDRLFKKGDLKTIVDAAEKKENLGSGEKPGVKIVWKSELIAGSPMALQTKFPESFRKAVTEVITKKVNIDYAVANGYCPAADKCLFNDEKTYGYAVADDKMFDGVRKVCELTGSSKCK